MHTVKWADNLVLLAKKEMVLQDMTDRLTETRKCYGMGWGGGGGEKKK
jgi:hypothetical protein